MKKTAIFVYMLVMLSFSLFAQEHIILKNPEDYAEKLAKNEVYLGEVQDVDYDNGLLYFLDIKYRKVMVVDYQTGALKKTLFRRGQGPYELMKPKCLRVKNNKVFVLDQGFNGIKIMDVKGTPVNEFKTKGMVGRRNIDVNDNDEIFVGEYSTPDKTYVSVYDLKGQKQRSLIKIPSKDGKLPLERVYYKIMLDPKGNILTLFITLRELKKFNPQGELTWETKIKNSILDKWPNNDSAKFSSSETINIRSSIFSITAIDTDKILIGHVSGGCIFDKNGKITTLLEPQPGANIQMAEIIGDRLLNVLVFGHYIYSYNIKEVLK